MSVGTNIKKLRLARDLTQVELAIAVGVATATITKYEYGTMPTLEIAGRIAAELGVSVNALLDEKYEDSGIVDEVYKDLHKSIINEMSTLNIDGCTKLHEYAQMLNKIIDYQMVLGKQRAGRPRKTKSEKDGV